MNTDAGRIEFIYRCKSVPYLWLILLLFPFTVFAQFTVHPDQPIGTPIVGFGAQMNPYLFCRPNARDVNDASARDLEKKVLALSPQHVRIFCLTDWWTPKG